MAARDIQRYRCALRQTDQRKHPRTEMVGNLEDVIAF
jgi:hypothetical protein